MPQRVSRTRGNLADSCRLFSSARIRCGEADDARINELWRITRTDSRTPANAISFSNIYSGGESPAGLAAKGRRRFSRRNCPSCALKEPSCRACPARGISRESQPGHQSGDLRPFSPRPPANSPQRSNIVHRILRHSGFFSIVLPSTPDPKALLPPIHVERHTTRCPISIGRSLNLAEIQTLFLRAGRIVDNPKIDLPEVSARENRIETAKKRRLSFKACKTSALSSRSPRLIAPISSANPCHPVW